MKDSYVFYKSFYDSIHRIKDKELKADIFETICELALYNNDIELTDEVGLMIMDLIKPQIKANNERYEKGLKYGELGGRPTTYNRDEIRSLIEQGYSNKEIEMKIGCSQSLVKNIRQKLDNNLGQKLDNNLDNKSITDNNANVNENENVNVNENDNVVVLNIFEFIEDNFGRTLNNIEIEKITSWKDNDLTRHAIKEAVLNNKCNINYIDKILYSYKKENIRTVSEAQNREKKFQETKNKTTTPTYKPNWLDQEIKDERKELSDEDKKLIERIKNSS